MPIINLNKVHDCFVKHIRDKFNIQEKAELIRMLTVSIEHSHEELLRDIRKKRRCDDCE